MKVGVRVKVRVRLCRTSHMSLTEGGRAWMRSPERGISLLITMSCPCTRARISSGFAGLLAACQLTL